MVDLKNDIGLSDLHLIILKKLIMHWTAQSFDMLAKSLNINSYRPHFGVEPRVTALCTLLQLSKS
jgi:hypothetical protein